MKLHMKKLTERRVAEPGEIIVSQKEFTIRNTVGLVTLVGAYFFILHKIWHLLEPL